MEAHVAIKILSAAAWAFLLFQSFRLRLVPKYRLVFAFIFYSIFLESSLPWIASSMGTTTVRYMIAYLVLVSINAVLTASVLLFIYGILGTYTIARHWHFIVVPCFLAYFAFSDDSQGLMFLRIVNFISLVITYLGVATIIRSRQCRRVRIGWNLKMVLLAITVPHVFQSVVISVYSLGLPLSYESFRFWQNATSLAGWIILAAGMIEYSPPTPVVAGNSESGQTNGDSGRERTVGNLSETREQLC